MRIYISGCHSGPNPSPGIGVARSLRLAFPDATLVGKDHSAQCSGLHDAIFDEVWVCRPWQEQVLARHLNQIVSRLAGDALYISGLDLEAVWLASAGAANVLVPPPIAFQQVAKPTFTGFADLPGVAVPPWCWMDADLREVHRFARLHDWRLWVKGAAYDAKPASNPRELEEARKEIDNTWGARRLHVQAGIRGQEVSIAFSAYRGKLLGAIFMEKRLTTEQGKTWAGRVSPVAGPLASALGERLAALSWSGGGELEFVRDQDGTLWLIDVNPRFPAWIHGATLAGYNLPGRLVGAAAGRVPAAAEFSSNEFIRTVVEIPVRKGLPQPPPRWRTPEAADASLGKHPSGMPQLQRRIGAKERMSENQCKPVPPWLGEFIIESDRPTPHRVPLPARAVEQFERCRDLAAALSQSIDVRVAYSTKTNPDPLLLALARRCGFLAEVISPEEITLALNAGFETQQLVLNGPVSATQSLAAQCSIAFADSVESLASMLEDPPIVCGLRLRPPGVASRFGIDAEDPREFSTCVELLSRTRHLDIGVSMHVQSTAIGAGRWAAAVRGTISLAAALGEVTGQRLVCLDLGGGWAAEDTEVVFKEWLPPLVQEAGQLLPDLRFLLLEPGKLLADPSAATVARVLEVRRRGNRSREVVVDVSVAELPTCRHRPHDIWAVHGERLDALERGEDRILGRLCLEGDIMREQIHIPDWLARGDRLVFCDTGGYDASMSWPFGMGRSNG